MLAKRFNAVFQVLYLSIHFILPLFGSVANGNDLREAPERIPIGALFPHGVNHLQTVFKHSIQTHNSNASQKFIVETAIEFVDHNDPATIVRQLQCLHFNRGIYAFLAPNFATSSHQSALSFANTYRVPFVGLPPTFSFHQRSHNEFYGINLEPNYWPAIVSVLKWYSWSKIIYLYDTDDGIFNLQELLRQSHRSDHVIQLSNVKRISNAGEGYKLLKSMDKNHKETMKYVILNCNLHISKALIAYHIQDTAMERERFHYLLTNLMLNDSWSREVPAAFNAVNITSFALPADQLELNKLNQIKNDIKRVSDFYYKEDEIPSLEEILTFDGTKVLLEAFNLIIKSNVNISKVMESESVIQTAANLTQKPVDSACPTLKPFKFGDIIANHLKITKTHGITGNIEFHSDGFRKNYTIEIFEISNSGLFEKIASWSDVKGITVRNSGRLRSKYNVFSTQNITYVVSSILEEPFLMRTALSNRSANQPNAQFEGYVKDLADLLAEKLNFLYEFRIVNDSRYGALKEPHAWSGMIGDLVRNEVDMAIAPLTINAARQKVIDFTQPFMTTGISIMIKKPMSDHMDFLSFLRPLSKEVWACIALALFAVSTVFYVASRLSLTNNGDDSYVSICSSICYSFGALLYQVAGVFPRSISSKIASGVWWFFVFIAISSYLSNLIASSVANRMQFTLINILGISDVQSDSYLHYDKTAFSITSVKDLSSQEHVKFGILRQSSTEAFFMQSKESIYSKMWEKMNEIDSVFVDSYSEGIERVRRSNGKYAFLLESAMNDYVNLRKPCDTIKIGKNFHQISYGIGIPIGSPLREKLNGAILNLKDSGDLERLSRKWWNERHQCNKINEKVQFLENANASLTPIVGAFIILIAGLILAFFVAILEYLCKRKNNTESTYTIAKQDEPIEERRNVPKNQESSK